MNLALENGMHDDVAALGTAPVPAEPYYDPHHFELEREAIFRRSWLHLGHVCELPEPGTFIVRSIEVADASILVTRGPDSVLRAFHNVCTHRGSELVAENGGKRASFSCRYHMWNFGYDGALRAAPDFDRFYVDKAECGLTPIALDTCGGLIFVNLERSPRQTLREFLGVLADELDAGPIARATHFSEYVYEMAGNWKLIADNFQENYHLRFVHARSAGSTGVGEDNPFGYPVGFKFHGRHRRQTLWRNPNARPAAVQGAGFAKMAQSAAADGLTSGAASMDYLGVFPNLFVSSRPLQQVHCIVPLAPHRSRGSVRLYWIGDDDCASRRFAREYALASLRDVHAEDRVSIESSQRGLKSGAIRHIHFQSQEVLCRHFFHAVQDAISEFQGLGRRRSV